jgi:signal transduction histidine kinase
VTKDKPFYYEYITKDGVVVLLDQYEWSRGIGITDKEVKKAQAARKREVTKGFADTKEA